MCQGKPCTTEMFFKRTEFKYGCTTCQFFSFVCKIYAYVATYLNCLCFKRTSLLVNAQIIVTLAHTNYNYNFLYNYEPYIGKDVSIFKHCNTHCPSCFYQLDLPGRTLYSIRK